MMLPQGALDLLENCDLPPPPPAESPTPVADPRARSRGGGSGAGREQRPFGLPSRGESMRLYAHRQWLRLLEAEKTTWLRRQKTNNAAAPVADPLQPAASSSPSVWASPPWAS
ncbi:unnamed protein product [Spirodela intermedia]|uniref:Uncharacterized protein n=1 Tax=Spirodela intermedia TaxID=51605 RepID=A0A7I8IM23_SPIIN|nr:unnamed protein product [Spirodela intermedia]CAA6658868.1 unnamed protein product [Spirodela intermedia]